MNWKSYSYELTFGRRGNHDGCYRPILREVVIGNASFGALVDSGTDITMIDMKVALFLGIEFDEKKTSRVWGAGDKDNEAKKAYRHTVTIEIPGFSETIISEVLFVEDLEFEIILGQQDFFKRFFVRFEEVNRKFYLKPAPTKDEMDI